MTYTWTCPKCGHRFASRNLSHSCGRHRIADHFAGRDPLVKRIYLRFVQLVRACGKVTIYAQKTRIVCMRDVRFAAITPRAHGLECNLWLDRDVAHPALHHTLPIGGGRSFVHYFRFDDPAQLDDTFAALVAESYAAHSGTAKERRLTSSRDR